MRGLRCHVLRHVVWREAVLRGASHDEEAAHRAVAALAQLGDSGSTAAAHAAEILAPDTQDEPAQGAVVQHLRLSPAEPEAWCGASGTDWCRTHVHPTARARAVVHCAGALGAEEPPRGPVALAGLSFQLPVCASFLSQGASPLHRSFRFSKAHSGAPCSREGTPF